MAAYYPDKPTTENERQMKEMMTGLASFYPCGYCADHLKERLVSDLYILWEFYFVLEGIGKRSIAERF